MTIHADSTKLNIYDSLPDKTIIKTVTDLFYEKVYEHPWMSQYFAEIDQDHISEQQTNYVTGVMGGPSVFGGRLPSNAHPHMFISDELFDLREQLMAEALDEAGAPPLLKTAWLKLDEAFRKAIVKKSTNECKKRFKTDDVLDFENPYKNAG